MTEPNLFSKISENYNDGKHEVIKRYLNQRGIFTNNWTLEASLIETGLHNELKLVFDELGEEMNTNVKAGAKNVDAYLAMPTEDNMEKILSSIADSRWGKGRFAHRLVKHISESAEAVPLTEKNRLIPKYIKNSITYLINKVKEQTLSI